MQSALAPPSKNSVSFPESGISPASVGRSIPLMRPKYMIAAAITRPLFPAQPKAPPPPPRRAQPLAPRVVAARPAVGARRGHHVDPGDAALDDGILQAAEQQ